MNVLITLNPGIGEDLGPNFLITSDVEGWSTTATDIELYAGVEIVVPDEATVIYIQSLGICLNILTLPIEATTTTTTSSTSTTTTSTTTEIPITTTTTTTEEITTTTTTTTMYIECGDYGYLYNFPTIENLNILAPEGYRVATLEDIVNLVDYLGGDLLAGGEMKTTNLWTAPNTGATDSVGFSAIPTGTRTELGEFVNILLKNNIWIDNR